MVSELVLMVFRIFTRVVARVVVGVVVGVVAGADEVYHHSSAGVVTGGVCAHLITRGPLLCVEEKTYLSMAGCRWSPLTWPLRMCTASSPGPTRTGLFHGAPRKTHGGGTLRWLLFVATGPHSLGGGGV
jgi:hypothetical protein